MTAGSLPQQQRQQTLASTAKIRLGAPPTDRRHCIWRNPLQIDTLSCMSKLLLVLLTLLSTLSAADLPTKKYLSLAAVKTMVAAAEAEASKQKVEVTLCIVDEHGTVIFLQKGDTAPLNTLDFAQKKARHAAMYGSPSKDASDGMKNGNAAPLAFPDWFPAQGGLPIKVDGQLLGGIAASGAKSEIDEAIAQAGIDALSKK